MGYLTAIKTFIILIDMLKYKYIYFSAFILLLLFSCEETTYVDEEECYDYDYSDCNTVEPIEGAIVIDLTINKANPEVEIIVFYGKPENLDTFTVETVTNPQFQVMVPLDNYYSAKAKYKVDENTVYVSDGDKIKSISSSVCDSTCWSISGGRIDVRLKYDNF